MSEVYAELNRALVRAGLPAFANKSVGGYSLGTNSPVDILVNARVDASPYAGILLDAAPKLTEPNEIEMVARCMSQSKGFADAVPWLLSLFHGHPQNGLSTSHLWAIGAAIYTINNRKFYSEVVSICREGKFGSARQMLMGALARAKTDEAYELLLACLDDPSVRAQAIEAIGRFGRTDAIPILDKLEVEKGLYVYKAKQTTLRRLERKLSK